MFVEELKLETLDEYNYHDTLSPSYSNNTAIFQFILLVGLKQNQKKAAEICHQFNSGNKNARNNIT
jgi:hypothetical protein